MGRKQRSGQKGWGGLGEKGKVSLILKRGFRLRKGFNNRIQIGI
jgi:hypothetical protein